VAGDPEDGEGGLGVLAGLERLAEHGLLRATDAPDGEPRFGMLETVREYALERLEASGEAAEARGRHAAHFLGLAEAAAPESEGAAQATWLGRLETEHDNLRAALRWLRERGDAEGGLRLAAALVRFWDTRDHLAEGRDHLAAMLALPGGADAVRAAALTGSAELATWQADTEAAAALAEEALPLWRAVGDPTGQARALWLLGLSWVRRGDPTEAALAEAEALAEAALEVARRGGDARGAGHALGLLGRVHERRGEPARSVAFNEQALAVWRELGDRAEECSTLGELAEATAQRGDHVAAAALWEEVLPLAREVGEAWMVAWYLEGRADLALADGRSGMAARLLGAAAAWRGAHGAPAPRGVGRTLAATRAALGEAAFAAAVAEGRGFSLEEAVAEAGQIDRTGFCEGAESAR
jgi:non-specific serine/threonine protein kinase